jgi:two-component system response regulator DctR
MSGLELQEELLRRGSLLPVIVISGFANIPSTVRLVGNGALTVLEKPFHHDDLFEAVDRALKRNADAVSRANFRDAIACRLAKLTEEERRVMELVVAGMPHKLIARKLGLAQRTVDRRRSSMYAKLSVESAAELATLLAEYSLGARLNDQPVPGVEARGAPCL